MGRALTSLAFLFPMALILLSCPEARVEPEKIIYDVDTCAHCQMLISGFRFSAQLVSGGLEARKFDDISCLIAYISQQKLADKGLAFVMDFESGAWLKANEATYLKSEQVRTPMSSGIIALGSGKSARGYLEKFGGRLMTWEELLKEARLAE